MYKKYTNKLGVPKSRIHKILLIMRLTTIILIMAIMQVSASTFAQRITLSEKNAKLSQVFDRISDQCGYDFVFTSNVLKGTKPVTINVKDTELPIVLEQIFASQPVSFSIEDKTVVVKAKSSSRLDIIVERFQAIDVQGKVVDQNGSPLPGASVKIKSSGKIVSTNANGEFNISKVDDSEVLVISYTGFLQRELNATSDLSNIVLEQSNSKLDEVQVIAYGTTSKRLATGVVNGIKAIDIERSPVGNPLLALSGRVPGIFINQNSGLSGGGAIVHIQGINSISKGNDPFYVVDGVPYTATLLPTLNNVLGSSSDGTIDVGSGNPFSYINPADIESIDVLKDADATAIYGSRAANGAILITTKKGKAGKTKVDITLQSGVGQVPHRLKLLNIDQYLTMRKEAFSNDGRPVPNSTTSPNGLNYDLTVWNQMRNTDWQKEFLGGSANYTDLQTSISGGSANTTFRLNAGYHRETTVFPVDYSDIKGSVGVSFNHSSSDNRFKASFSANYLNDRNELPVHDFTLEALSLAPNAPALYHTDGGLNWERIPSGTDSISTWSNPLRNSKNIYEVTTNNLISNANLSYTIFKGLSLKSSFGFTDLSTKELSTGSLQSILPEERQYNTSSASYGNGRINSWIIEPQIVYNVNLSKGALDFLVGSTFQKMNRDLQRINGSGYPSELLLKDYSSASTITKDRSVLSTYKYSAIFARLSYNWEDTYIFNFTARRDGSSRFGSENQLHNFGAIGVAWLFCNEQFVKDKLTFLSFGKLRASYGTSGNDQIGDYAFLNQYSPIGDIPSPYQGAIGLEPTGHLNPYLQWELTKKTQAGVDLGFLKDRILVGINYFRNRSSNQLIGYTLPYQSGFEIVTKNFPATVQNTGWEMTLTTENIQTKSLSWSSSFNLTTNKNKLIEFPNLSESTYANSLIIGRPINVATLYSFAGVEKTTGLFQYHAADGTITTAPNGSVDNTVFRNPSPSFYGGIQNDLKYRGFELSFLLQFVKQQRSNLRLGTTSLLGGYIWNEPVQVMERWQKEGDITDIQKFSTGIRLFDVSRSDFAFADASYIRLKNVSLSYMLPESLTNKVKIQKCRVFIQGQNLLTFTNYIGLDPESASTTTLPPLRVITAGLQITL